MCSCPVVQCVGCVAKCMLMCMHGSNISYYTIYMIFYWYIPLHSPICLPSLLVYGISHDAYGYICIGSSHEYQVYL